MGVAEKDPSPDGATPLAGPCSAPGPCRGRTDVAAIRGLQENKVTRSRGDPGAYATGLYDFAPFGASGE